MCSQQFTDYKSSSNYLYYLYPHTIVLARVAEERPTNNFSGQLYTTNNANATCQTCDCHIHGRQKSYVCIALKIRTEGCNECSTQCITCSSLNTGKGSILAFHA
ncbi:hypothetical protein GDO86_001758 [Hymenochirus boettgeri]|uniref:Uncharacterized protein n=1 Tax=Hymenochirus boettgeri TaxID=247094 RepID=A0A8T2KID9_9PIPI|nr:hypothetical protein GDO86_001758 [Hymenochirus boettgeri]